MKINDIPVREVEENYVNIHPIQAAGRLTAEAMKASSPTAMATRRATSAAAVPSR